MNEENWNLSEKLYLNTPAQTIIDGDLKELKEFIKRLKNKLIKEHKRVSGLDIEECNAKDCHDLQFINFINHLAGEKLT